MKIRHSAVRAAWIFSYVFIMAGFAGAVESASGVIPTSVGQVANPALRYALESYSPNYDSLSRDRQIAAFDYVYEQNFGGLRYVPGQLPGTPQHSIVLPQTAAEQTAVVDDEGVQVVVPPALAYEYPHDYPEYAYPDRGDYWGDSVLYDDWDRAGYGGYQETVHGGGRGYAGGGSGGHGGGYGHGGGGHSGGGGHH